MDRIRRLSAVALVLAVGLGYSGTANAGPVWDWLCGICPAPTYSPVRYWAPTVARTYDCLHGPHLSVFAPDRHPESPPSMAIIQYRCAAAPPEATLYTVPIPPAESRFQYFERTGSGGAIGQAATENKTGAEPKTGASQ